MVTAALYWVGGDVGRAYSHRYGSIEFQRLTATRPLFLKRILEQGYTVFYNDIDMVWRQNAWPVLDRLLANEESPNHNDTTMESILWHDGPREFCSCLLYLPPNALAHDILQAWQDEISTQQYNNDQPALNKALQKRKYVSLITLQAKHERIRVVPNAGQFPHGKLYFHNATTMHRHHKKQQNHQQQQQQQQDDDVVIVHNNWIRGKRAKRRRWEDAGLWNPSGKLGT